MLGTVERVINTSIRKEKFNDEIKDQIQLVIDKFLKIRLKDVDGDDSKKVSFKEDEANSKAWNEEAFKKLSKTNGSMGATIM